MNREQAMPASVEAERTILGSIFLYNEVFFDDLADLSADDFSLDSHRVIFRTISEIMFGMVEGVTSVDIITLSNELDRRRELDTIGNRSYLFSLTENLPRRLSVKEYVAIVKDKAHLRKLMNICSIAQARCADQSEDAAKIREDMESSLLEVAAEGDSGAVRLGSVTPEVEKRVEKSRQITEERTALELSWGLKGLDDLTKGLFGGELTVVSGESGGGKLMDIEEPIPTPHGFIRNGDLKNGDQIFGEDGNIYEVLKAHPVVEEEAFLVTFDDGSFTHVHAGHLWHTWTFKDRQKKFKQSLEFRTHRRLTRPDRGGKGVKKATPKDSVFENYLPPKVIGSAKTTLEIMHTLSVNNCERANHSIPLAKALQLPYKPLPIDPYVFGAWLGDGTSNASTITIGKKDAIEMGGLLAERGYPLRGCTAENMYSFSDGDKRQKARNKSLAAVLRKMRVLKNKHIPHDYLWASEHQRLELLCGLMDTDGTCLADGQSAFTNTNVDLAIGVYHLASSLGAKPTFIESSAILYGKDCGPKYDVKWTSLLQCFHLKRKLARLPRKTRETQNWRYIIDVKPAGKKEMRCLTTSNPSHLYLFGQNFNVTHNTIEAMQITLANAQEGTPCAWFSMEMSKEKIAQRCYPFLSQTLTADMIRDPRLMNLHTHVPEMQKMSEAVGRLPIWIDDTSPLHINKLVARTRMMRRKFGIRLFVCDYLQLIQHSCKTEIDGIRDIVFKLRDLVKSEPTIHIILLSQYSKADGFSKKRKRTKGDLYGGSAIHHAAQNVVLLSVEDPENKEPNDYLDVEIRVDKQRDGRVGKVACMLDRSHLRFMHPQPPLRY